MNLIHYQRGMRFFSRESRPLRARMFKCIVVMKLIIALIAITLQVSAAAYSQQLTLNFKNAKLFDVLQAVSKQSKYEFTLPPDNQRLSNPVTINIKELSIEKTLQLIFSNQPFNFRLEDNVIIIQTKTAEQKKSESININHRLQDIEGVVRNQDGKPLERATVVLKGTNRGAVTDALGNFYFKDVPSSGTLIVTIIGHETVEVTYQNGIVPVVILKEVNANLKEVVIVNKGYYTADKDQNTGSVGSITADEISRQPINNPLAALQGRLPGIYISNTSGVPGAVLNVNIRGRNSLRENGNEPLYIVDGIPFNSTSLAQTQNAAGSQLSPFTNIRPDDIETIDVLKDADATAIYGSRGANGVILITTKRGKAGKSHVDFNFYKGFGKVSKFLDLMNTAQYLEMRIEALKNANRQPFLFERDINKSWSPTNNSDRYTDWQKVFIGGTADVTNANVSLSGGNETIQYITGLSYRKETTVFPGDYSNTIGSANIALSHTSENKKLRINTTVNYSNNDNKLPTVDFTNYIFTAPNAPALYDEFHQLNWQNNTFNNPFGLLNQKSNTISENFLGNLTISYEILRGLQLKANIGYNTTKVKEQNLTPFSSLNPANSPASDYRTLIVANNDSKSWITEPQLTYNKNFGKHVIDALIGTSFQSSESNGTMQTGYGFSSDILMQNIGAAQYSYGANSYSQYKYNALFARIGYTYADKYIFNLTGRRDGSSRFGPGEQFGNFGAIGLAWIFTKENAIENLIPGLNFGKLRGSIGRTGNDQISDYNYLSKYDSPQGYFGTSGLKVGNIGNPYYRWETINKAEIALELGFLNNAVRLNTNYYRNRTKNQLVAYTLPGISGFPTVTKNLPATIQNTGTEVDLTISALEKGAIKWTTSANLTVPRNKLVEFPNLEGSGYAEAFKVGYPLNTKLLYHYIGVDPNTGVYAFEDVNKDGELTLADRFPITVGQEFYGGINNSVSYKSFSLEIFFQFVKQKGKSFVGFVRPGGYSLDQNGANMPISILNRWQSPGDHAMFQKYSVDGTTTSSFSNYNLSDANFENASFIRLKNVSLSWSLSNNLLNRLKIKNLRIYLQGQNLLTFSNFNGLDPETNVNGNTIVLPTQRVLTAGVQISL